MCPMTSWYLLKTHGGPEGTYDVVVHLLIPQDHTTTKSRKHIILKLLSRGIEIPFFVFRNHRKNEFFIKLSMFFNFFLRYYMFS